jgi:hypothetical protein
MLAANNSNTEWRYVCESGINSLSITTQGSFGANDEAYYTVVIKSGLFPLDIGNTFDAYFSGDDCSEGRFTPVANKTYDLGIWWNGVKWQCVVGGSV